MYALCTQSYKRGNTLSLSRILHFRDSRLRMFLCSSSSLLGLWLRRLKKKEKNVLVHFLHEDCRGNYFNISMVLDGSADKQELSVVKRVVLIYTFFGVHPKGCLPPAFLPLLGENFHAQLQHGLFIMINLSWYATHNYTKEITLRLH